MLYYAVITHTLMLPKWWRKSRGFWNPMDIMLPSLMGSLKAELFILNGSTYQWQWNSTFYTLLIQSLKNWKRRRVIISIYARKTMMLITSQRNSSKKCWKTWKCSKMMRLLRMSKKRKKKMTQAQNVRELTFTKDHFQLEKTEWQMIDVDLWTHFLRIRLVLELTILEKVSWIN
jgi:hypothetical protein